MGRSKIKREYRFKPMCKEFAPVGHETHTAITLDHDEIEAIFLTDSQNLYQDDAAKKMGVSRPTFSKILKSARFKVATALVSCKKLVINDEKQNFKLMIPTAQEGTFDQTAPTQQYLAIVTVDNERSYSISYQDNPVYTKESKPGLELPQLANELDINFFVSQSAGAGLVNSLLSMGVYTYKTSNFTIKELIDTLMKEF
ncbi:MAG: DUF134 domain-containing protein [Campylobacterota bacterium]